MRTQIRWIVALLAVAGVTGRAAFAAEKAVAVDPAEQRIREALEKKVDVDFPGTPFDEVIDAIRKEHGLNLVVDQRSAIAEGIGRDTTIKLKLTGVRLRNVLALILGQVNLRCTIRKGVVFIANREALEETAEARVYNVRSLVGDNGDVVIRTSREESDSNGGGSGWGDGWREPETPIGELADVIADFCLGGERTGRMASVETYRDAMLAVQATPAGHERAGLLVDRLRGVWSRKSPDRGQGVAASPDREKADLEVEQHINKQLAKRVSVYFGREPFEKVIDFVRNETGANIVVDQRSLVAEGIGPDTWIALQVKDVPIADVLDLILEQVNLVYAIRNEILFIGNREALHARGYVIKIYDVRDLVAVPPRPPDAAERIRAALERRVSVEFKDTPFEKALNHIRGLAGVNIVVDQRALIVEGIGPDTTIKLTVKDVRLENALALLLEHVNLRHVVRNEVVYVTNEIDGGGLQTRVFGPRDLLIQSGDYGEEDASGGNGGNGGNSGNGSSWGNGLDNGWGGNGDDDDDEEFNERRERLKLARDLTNLVRRLIGRDRDREADEDEGEKEPTQANLIADLSTFIQNTVLPKSWADFGGSSDIRTFRDSLLVISHTPRAHAEIATLLARLRAVSAAARKRPLGAADKGGEPQARVYDVRDLLVEMAKREAPKNDTGAKGSPAKQPPDGVPAARNIKSLGGFIKGVVAPDTWTQGDSEGKATSIQTFRDEMLIVSHSPAVHERIWALLTWLRTHFTDGTLDDEHMCVPLPR